MIKGSLLRHRIVCRYASVDSKNHVIQFQAPVMVKYSEKEKSFGHFATGLCAIIGGVFTVAGLIDKLVYTSSKIIQQKIDLGKMT